MKYQLLKVDEQTSLVPMPDLPHPILIDTKHAPILNDQKRSSSIHRPPRWIYDDTLNQIYTINTNQKRRYFVDLVKKTVCHSDTLIVNGDAPVPHIDLREEMMKIGVKADVDMIDDYSVKHVVSSHTTPQYKRVNEVYYAEREKDGDVGYFMRVPRNDAHLYVRISARSIETIHTIDGKPAVWKVACGQVIRADHLDSKTGKRRYITLEAKIGGEYTLHRTDFIHRNGDMLDFRIDNIERRDRVKERELKKREKEYRRHERLHRRLVVQYTDEEDNGNPLTESQQRLYDRMDVEIHHHRRLLEKWEGKNEAMMLDYEIVVQDEYNPDRIAGCRVVVKYRGHFHGDREINPVFKVYDPKADDYRFYMHCYPRSYARIDEELINRIRHTPDGKRWLSWHLGQNGYVAMFQTDHIRMIEGQRMVYLHEYIMEKFDLRKKNKPTIDHINRDKLDNRRNNLKYATQSEQNRNRDRCQRKFNAQNLPDGIDESEVPKYVTYDTDKEGSEGFREYWRISLHPTMVEHKIPVLSSSKSFKKGLTARDKLNEVKEMLKYLDRGKLPSSKNPYPVYVRLGPDRGKWALFYENRGLVHPETKKSLRGNLTMRIKSKDIKGTYAVFREKVQKKYKELGVTVQLGDLLCDPTYPDYDP